MGGALRSSEASFFGSQTNKVDAKGRIAVPADFRRALDLKTFNGFYCMPSLEGPYVECGGGDWMDSLKAVIKALDPFDPDRRALQRVMLGRTRTVNLDAEGRFSLPDVLRQHAGIEGQAFFIGLGDTFQIWRAEGAEEAVASDEDRARAALSRLKNVIGAETQL